MSCHYSPEEEEGCSARTCSDGDLSDTSRSTTTPSASCEPASMTACCPMPPSSAMSVHSSLEGTPQHIRDWLTSLQPDSPASPSASQARDLAPPTAAICGPKPSQPFAWYDRDTACWRTFQGSLLADTLEPFLATWPKAGMTLAGEFYPLPKWERRIEEIGSGLWPSPKALDRYGIETSPQNHAKYGSGMTLTQAARRSMWPTPKSTPSGPDFARMNRDGSGGDDLARAVARTMLPTPNARDWRSGKGRKENGHTPQLPEVIGGQLNPPWVEWLMGWPLGWTDLKPLAMGRFRQWSQQLGRFLTNHTETDQ